jgi:alginate O-acetyltransferase complex protein AlgJ
MAGARTFMSPARRYLAAAILALLLAPAAGMLVAPAQTRSVMERRLLAPAPARPRTAKDWTALPRRIDAYVSDHFAGREALVRAALLAEAKAGLKPAAGINVVQGKDGWLLLQPGLLGATGGETSPRQAGRYAAFVCDLDKTVRGRGAAFLFAPAPGPAEIYPEAVPDWVPRGAPTQPELVLQAARACGVPPLDLRPAMLAAKGGAPLYQRHDSHWTNAGALVAFNAMAEALGQPWTIDPGAMGWKPTPARDSDLVRLAGAQGLPAELIPEPPEGPDSRPQTGALADLGHGVYPPAFLVPGRAAHPVVLIIGDSYTSDFMAQYFRRAGVTLAWVHQAQCRFDRRIFDRVRPDMVVLMPASREAACR